MGYWEDREQEHIELMKEHSIDYEKEISKRYAQSLKEIENDINRFYANYAKTEGISILEAKKRASTMDVQKFADKAAQYVKDKDFSSQANKELRLYNLTMKVNRLELLKSNIGLELTALSDDMVKYYYNQLTGEALAEIERQAGILGESVWKDKKAVKEIIEGSFHNATFSQRIWANQAALKAEIDKLLITSLTQGKHPRTLASKLMELFDVSRKEAERLLITESTRIQTETQKKSFEKYGYKEYTYIAEPSACPICKALDDEKFKVADMAPGTNAAPMHPHCRCSVAAHYDRGKWRQ